MPGAGRAAADHPGQQRGGGGGGDGERQDDADGAVPVRGRIRVVR